MTAGDAKFEVELRGVSKRYQLGEVEVVEINMLDGSIELRTMDANTLNAGLNLPAARVTE